MQTANIPVYKYILRCMEIFCCLFENRLDTKMLRIHLFSIFAIKTPRTLVVLASLGLLIVKTLTNVLLHRIASNYSHTSSC